MGDKKRKVYTSTENWLKRYKIVFFVTLFLMFIVLMIGVALYSVELQEAYRVQEMIQNTVPAAIAPNLVGGNA